MVSRFRWPPARAASRERASRGSPLESRREQLLTATAGASSGRSARARGQADPSGGLRLGGTALPAGQRPRWAEGGAPRRPPPSRARSGTGRWTGSGSAAREREPTVGSMGPAWPPLQPVRVWLGLRLLRERDEAPEPRGHRGLRHRRVRARGELARGERRMSPAELAGRLEAPGRACRGRRPPRAGAPRRAASGRSGSDGRGSRDPRWRGGSRRRGAPRRAPAPRVRAPCRMRPPRRGTPRSPPSSSRTRSSASRGRRPGA